MRKIKVKKERVIKKDNLEFNSNFVNDVVQGIIGTVRKRVIVEIVISCLILIGGVTLCL